MEERERTYIAIDLKSFFASVECVERGLNPLTTNLVVADARRTSKTICLAVSPSLKAYGIGGRARLFEVIERVGQVNRERLKAAGGKFTGESADDGELKANPKLRLGYVTAPPHMARYIDYSTRIYAIYLKYISSEDIHVYSIDEVFIDATSYLRTYHTTAHALAMTIIRDILKTTGITATAGIGTNLYLCKVAMDIVAKHIPADSDGVRVAELDEMSYRRKLWDHRPLTSFWRVGRGTAQRLGEMGLYTMGDIARQSVDDENVLYNQFGVGAELLIDHAWGWEPCTIADIKAYRPDTNSHSSGQVLKCPYTFEKARVVAREMAGDTALALLDEHCVTDQIALTVGYDVESLTNPDIRRRYHGPTALDHYGRVVPKPAHGTEPLGRQTSSAMLITKAVANLFDRIVNRDLLVRRLNVTANHVVHENEARHLRGKMPEPGLFDDYDAIMREHAEEERALEKERRVQEAVLSIKKAYGKNALLKGLDFEDGATAKERNSQIGGHNA